MSRFVHRRAAETPGPVGCVSVILDEFVDTDGTLLTAHETNEGYPWDLAWSLFYPSIGPDFDWAVQINKLVPDDFITGGMADIFNYVDVDIDALKYEIYLTFSMDVIPGSYMEVGIISNLQPLSTPTAWGWVQHYAYLPLSEGSDTATVSSTQDDAVEDGADEGDTAQYREGSYGDYDVPFPRLEIGEHVMKVAIDRTTGTMVATLSVDDVLLDTRNFDTESYDWYGSTPFPTQIGKVGFNLKHAGDADNVKVLKFEVKICSGETLPAP